MSALATMPSTSQAANQLSCNRSSSSTARPAVCFWQPGARRIARRGPQFGQATRPQAFGRSGVNWGCGPGMGGGFYGPNMAGVMNKPLAEILQQLERDFGAAAQQAQGRNSGQDSNPSAHRNGAMRLPVDTIETDDAIWYFFDLPGLEKKDLQIQANQQDKTITVSGERFQPDVGEDDSKQIRNLQRRFGKFCHTIALPKDADSQLISAKADKGVLRIKVLKATTAEPEMQTVPID